jgi:glycosyltransferase involved in cell wall biosynthesis
MRRVLCLIPSLDYSGAAKQLTLLASHLIRDQFHLRVGVLQRTGPFAKQLSAAGVAMDVLGRGRAIDPGLFLRLRQLQRSFQPHVIHAWGREALRAVAWAGGRRGAAIVVSHPWPPPEDERRDGASWLVDRWLLRRADRVVVQGPVEVQRSRRLGVDEERLVVIPPGVLFAQNPATEAATGPVPVPPGARWLVCVGPIARHKGFHDALWAFDILKYLYNDLHLLVIGEGPDRERLEQFGHAIHILDRVHFLGPRLDVTELMVRSELVWVLSRARAGLNVALEGMAAGRPVLAWRLPAQAEIIADGETGFLVPLGDKALLARQTRVLLDDDVLRRRMGEAGQKRVAEHFSVDSFIRRFGQLYEKVSGE